MGELKNKGFLYETTVKAIAKQKRIACEVCGLEFTPLNDEAHYIVETHDGTLSDAFDCPQCGCQVVVNERYERHERMEPLKTTDAPEKPTYRNYYNYPKTDCKPNRDRIRYTFQNVKSFTNALERIHECMEDYMYITQNAFNDIVGLSGPYTDELVGWVNILGMKIEVNGNGYTIIMPPYNWFGYETKKRKR